MNTKRMAQAARTLAIGLGEFADALDEPEGALRTATATAVSPSPAIPELPPVPLDEEEAFLADLALPAAKEPVGDQGHEAICPRHRKPYRRNSRGFYCSFKSDDPMWSRNGFCSITPKNAAKWLEIQAAA